jgi:hypothetical protein
MTGHLITERPRSCSDCGTEAKDTPGVSIPIDIFLTPTGKRPLCLGDLANRRLRGEVVVRSIVP